jgi:hypothetical protein
MQTATQGRIMNPTRAVVAAGLVLVVAGCSGENTRSAPIPQGDASVNDSAPDSTLDVLVTGEGQSHEACMDEICTNDLHDVCCCNPTSVEVTASGSCTYDYPSDIPTQYGAFTPLPDLIYISTLDESGDETTVPRVTDESECDEYDGFYFEFEDGGAIPDRILLCPGICAAAEGSIRVQSGCYTIACC